MDRLQDVAYQPFYCEENIWLLAQRDELFAGVRREVVFIVGHRPGARVACWYQRAARPFEAVAWDYHVVLADLPGGAETPEIWDLDTRLPCPCPASLWVQATFQDPARVPEQFHPLFSVAPAELYLRELATDRSHMRDPDGSYHRPPPPWDPPGAPRMTLPAWVSPIGGPGVVLDRVGLERRWRL